MDGLAQKVSYAGNEISEHGLKGAWNGGVEFLKTEQLIALIVSPIPTFGNAAYPIEAAITGVAKTRELAEFILYDYPTKLGRSIPIYGGGRLMYWLNRLPDAIVRNRSPDKLLQ